MAASGCWLLAGCILYNLKERRKTSPRQINGVGVLLSWASGMSTAGDRGKGGGETSECRKSNTDDVDSDGPRAGL